MKKKIRKRFLNLIRDNRGEGYVDVIVLVLCAVMVLALSMRVMPVFIAKQQLDTFATELVREAEISGRVGSETSRRAAVLTEKTGLHPNISWSRSGKIQLNQEVTVTLTMDTNIGLFGDFASFPITLRAQLCRSIPRSQGRLFGELCAVWGRTLGGGVK